MSTGPDNIASEIPDPLDPEILAEPPRPSRPVPELLAELEQTLADQPEDQTDEWKLAVLETVGQWPESSEDVAGKSLCYLIGVHQPRRAMPTP